MPRPKPEVVRTLISLRMLPSALSTLDKRRGGLSRAEYLEAILAQTEAAKAISAKPKPISPKPVEDIGVGAPKAAPGSRLKKR
jgi:hypothetical protein